MHKEINTEKINTLGKDLLDTVSELTSITKVAEEVFLKERKKTGYQQNMAGRLICTGKHLMILNVIIM